MVILGSIGVGKTCLIMWYKTGKILDNFPSIQEPNYIKIKKNNK